MALEGGQPATTLPSFSLGKFPISASRMKFADPRNFCTPARVAGSLIGSRLVSLVKRRSHSLRSRHVPRQEGPATVVLAMVGAGPQSLPLQDRRRLLVRRDLPVEFLELRELIDIYQDILDLHSARVPESLAFENRIAAVGCHSYV